MRDFSSRLYVPSATDLNLVNAEFYSGFFYRAVSVEDTFFLADTVNADINTFHTMGTAAMMLHVALLWTYTSLCSAFGVCTVLLYCC